MRNLIKKIIYIAALLLAILYFLVGTNMGLYVIQYTVSLFLPLKINHLQGSLINGLSITDLKYQSSTINFSLDHLEGKWVITKNGLDIETIKANNIAINMSETKSAKSSNTKWNFRSLKWLKFISIHKLSVNNLGIKQNNQTIFNLQNLLITPKTNHYYDIAFHSTNGNITGRYRITADNSLDWNINLNIDHLNLNSLIYANNSDIKFSIDSNGTWNGKNKVINFKLNDIRGKFGKYPIKGNLNFNYQNGLLDIQQAEIFIADAMAKLSGKMSDDSNLTWHMAVPDLNKVTTLAKGRVNSDGKITGPLNHLDILAKLNASKISFYDMKLDTLILNSQYQNQSADTSCVISNLNLNDYLIPDINLKVNSNLKTNNLNSQILIIFGKGNTVSGNIALDDFLANFPLNQPIKGELKVLANQLNKLIAIPEVTNLQGNLKGDISFTGFLNHPNILINAIIDQGKAFIPRLKVNLKDIELKGRYLSGEPVKFSGEFKSGEGTGNITGSFMPESDALPVEITLEGNKLQIVHLPEYEMIVSPKISLSYADHQTYIKGTFPATYAKITPTDFSSIMSLPEETIIIAKEPKENSLPQNLSFDIQVELDKKSLLKYENLETKLEGNLSISKLQGRLPTASGELHTVKGKYNAYGSLLKIKQGRLIYTGNLLTNPGLDIKAVKEIETLAFAQDQSQFAGDRQSQKVYQGSKKIFVGLLINGTLKKPYISFFSNPTGLSQTDILSYLVFGYPQSRIKDMNSLALLSNVVSGLNKGSLRLEKVTNKIQKVFGIDHIGMTSVDTFDDNNPNVNKNKTESNTALSIEKKIGKKISIQYRMGIFNSLYVLNLKYKINKLFSIQSETSNKDKGADLLFEYEHD